MVHIAIGLAADRWSRAVSEARFVARFETLTIRYNFRRRLPARIWKNRLNGTQAKIIPFRNSAPSAAEGSVSGIMLPIGTGFDLSTYEVSFT